MVLALLLLADRPSGLALAGVLLGLCSAALLAFRSTAPGALAGWLGLALASLVMQGVGAFVAKVVVSGQSCRCRLSDAHPRVVEGLTLSVLPRRLVPRMPGSVKRRSLAEPFDDRGRADLHLRRDTHATLA